MHRDKKLELIKGNYILESNFTTKYKHNDLLVFSSNKLTMLTCYLMQFFNCTPFWVKPSFLVFRLHATTIKRFLSVFYLC